MPDLEFLPAWYPQARRSKRLVILQAWVTLAIILSLACWFVVSDRQVKRAERELAAVDAELERSRSDLGELEELLALEKQLVRQDQVLAMVGTHVEAARLITALDEVMPPEMALLDMEMNTEERQVEATGLGAATSGAGQRGKDKPKSVERILKVKLVGVTPTDVDLANFLTRLTSRRYLSDVTLSYTKNKLEGKHLMRQFEVLFQMHLGTAQVPQAGA
jgi:Tfp pilus assembly protein PilN